jgi:predicted Na+-dependent transporter
LYLLPQVSCRVRGSANERSANKSILSVTDRGSILLMVDSAFSASVVQSLWQWVPVATLEILAQIDAVLWRPYC